MAQTFIATIATGDGPASAVVRDGLVHRIPGAPGTRAMLADWDGWLDRAAAERLDEGVPLAQCTLLPPIVDPPNVYMVGANYGDHAREMAGLPAGAPIERSPSGPFFFLKPTTTLIGDGAPVLIGEGITQLDWEVELAAVIGRRAERVPESAALDHVAGYTIVNDVSARDAFVRPGAPPAFTYDWLAQKGRAASCPCGPWILPARDCPDPGRLALRLSVNDELMQDSSTAEMLFSLEEQIAYLSRILPLVVGDVVATGTCAGVGAGRGRFLAAGDLMRAEVESIGVLISPVEAV